MDGSSADEMKPEPDHSQPEATDAGADLEAGASIDVRISALESELSRLRRRQEVFASGISHDLRAPLRSIDGFALQIGREAEAGQPANPAHVERIRSAVARMGGLLDSLIAYSRAGRAVLDRQRVDPGFIAEWVLMDLAALHPGLELATDVQSGMQAFGDERLLKLLLEKVLENSLRFAGSERPLRLRVGGEQESGGFHLVVEDSGIGMALRDPDQPFEPFQRLHGASQGGGDGMGLAIARLVAERHGGRIWAESAEGEGCRIHLWLPDAPA